MIRGMMILIALAIALPAWGADEVTCNDAGTQQELNACAADDLKRADKALNDTYAALVKKESGDPVFIRKLRAAQRAWIAFRDAELEATFACKEENPYVCWGSMYPMCSAFYQAKLTRDRTARLRELLDEGRPADGCH